MWWFDLSVLLLSVRVVNLLSKTNAFLSSSPVVLPLSDSQLSQDALLLSILPSSCAVLLMFIALLLSV